MKKQFTLTLAVIGCGIALNAQTAENQTVEPKCFSDFSTQQISPDGKFIASQVYGTVKIVNLETDQMYEYLESEGNAYALGNGNAISNTGVVLGSQTMEDASYWKDGQWHLFNCPNENAGVINTANGITPDGTRVCGAAGLSAFSMTASMMQVPVYWELQDDGTYGEAIELPYPEKDFAGCTPQYINAITISDDGKTIIGQVTDSRGFLFQPIVYRQADNGTWSYEMVHPELMNPQNLEFPADPGNGPDMPDHTEYMSGDEIAAYEDAYRKWQENGFIGESPVITDYMTPENKEAYMEALAQYEIEQQEWEIAFTEFDEIYQQCIEAAPQFAINNVKMTPDGKYFATTSSITDYNTWSTTFEPWRFNLETGEYEVFNNIPNLLVNCITADGTILAAKSINEPSEGFVLQGDKFIPLYDWMLANHPAYAQWMDIHMRWTYETFDPATYEPVLVEQGLLSGLPIATPDFSILSTWVQNIWDFVTTAESFVFNLKGASGIDSIEADNTETAEGETVIYDLMGRRLEKATAPGIYIVNGEKVAIR